MTHTLGAVIAGIILALAFWHFWMAMRQPGPPGAAVPSQDGRPVFVPTRQVTVAVGAVLCLLAGLVAATAGAIPSALPPVALRWLSYALALGLLARAIGDFRLVGFFKTVRGSRFATIDTVFYSPLCLAMAAGVAYVAATGVQ